MGRPTNNVDMSVTNCAKCAAVATDVINAERKIRRGWYCAACGHMTPAIGRERKLEVVK
jgi:hypothetical protein